MNMNIHSWEFLLYLPGVYLSFPLFQSESTPQKLNSNKKYKSVSAAMKFTIIVLRSPV
jgi:hypothetical protein